MAVAQEVRNGNAACVVDFDESAETVVERLCQLGLTEKEIAHGVVYCSPDSPFDEVAAAHLEIRFRRVRNSSRRQLTLGLVDSIAGAMSVEGLDPDVGRDMARFYHGVPRWLKDQGLAVLLIDEVIKSRDSRGLRGTRPERRISRLDGAAYSFTEMAPFGRGITGRVRVTVSRDRGGFVRQHAPGKVMGTLTLTSSAEDGSVTAAFKSPAAVSLGEQARAFEDLRIRMSRVIRENPGSTSRKLRGLIDGANAGTKDKAGKWLVDNGYVMKLKDGRRTVYHSVTPYEGE